MVWILVLSSLGFNFCFWLIMGIVRYIYELFEGPRKKREKRLGALPIQISDVAAVVPAHNEAISIRRTLNALIEILPRQNIYVVSDYSTDKTIDIVRSLGIRSLDLSPNRGKAKALKYIMEEYGLFKAYKAILINDADCIVGPNYMTEALQYFRDENVVAVTPAIGRTRWPKTTKISELFFTAYRARVWRIMVTGMRFGQAWRFINVLTVIPGGFSIYRTSVLEKIEIDAPGLTVEDINMTFEIHKKKLGRIVFSEKIYVSHQDPLDLDDYVKQIRRWDVGFWQTIKKQGIWPSVFWVALGALLFEALFFCLLTLMLPLIISIFILNGFEPIKFPFVYSRLTIMDIFIGIFFIDYLVTVLAAILEKKPIILLLGLGFFLLRFVDAMIFLISIPEAFFRQSSGSWVSPKRV